MRFGLLALLLVFGAASAEDWRLPRGGLKQSGPRTYRFTCDYYHLDVKGNLVNRERIAGDYTRGLPAAKHQWNNVTVVAGKDFADVFGPAQKRDFMEGFSYSQADSKEMLKPEFFQGFPPLAMNERNLVWDTEMLVSFGQEQFDKLTLNKPYHYESGDVPLAGAGTFHNRDIELVWTGFSERAGRKCAVIDYRAHFNRLDVKTAGIELIGRSHYWGQIWVSVSTRQIEYATLYEDVLGELKYPGGTAPMILNVFRKGTFEPAARPLP